MPRCWNNTAPRQRAWSNRKVCSCYRTPSLLGDIYLIPSVCPETFSYTTEEAMTMGLPVACYDLGAPAERVKKYKKGLIISKIDAQTTLKEIEQFFQR